MLWSLRPIWSNERGNGLPVMAAPRMRGFTLLEVLVALALLALMMGLAFGLFTRMQRDSRNLSETLDRTAELRALFQQIRQDLSRMPARPITGAAPLTGRAQKEEEQDLDVLVVLRLSSSRSPFEQVSYGARREPDGTAVVTRSVYPLITGGPASGGGVLLHGIRGWRARYLTANGEWIDQWNTETLGDTRRGQPLLPRALRLEVELPSGAVWHSIFSLEEGLGGG